MSAARIPASTSRVNIPAGYHADHLAGARSARQRCRHRRRARALGNHPLTLGEQENRLPYLVQRNGQRTIQQVAYQRPHLGQHALATDAIDETRLVLDLDRSPGSERCRQWRCSLDFGRVDTCVGFERAKRGRDPAAQSAAAIGDDHRIDIGQILQDLQADCAMAGNDIAVAHGMDKQPRQRVRIVR